MNTTQTNTIKQAYAAFNARNIPAVLQHMNPSVLWANGWEGGHVQGHAAVQDYWTRQWQELDPTVAPIDFHQRQDGTLDVTVHQVVKNKEGKLLFDGIVHHVYTFEEEKISRMDIDKE